MRNMKKVSLSVFASIIASVTVLAAPAQANGNERLAMSLCESAKNDDRRTMRKKLDTAKIRLNRIYENLQCGAEGSLLRVATNAGSLNAAKYIATKIKAKGINQVESDGDNIIQYTEKLVANGDASKQAFVDLFNSKI